MHFMRKPLDRFWLHLVAHFGKILEKSIERFSHKMHEDMAFFSENLHFPITSERKKL